MCIPSYIYLSLQPSVREMSILLETNRKLTEQLTELQTTHQQDKMSFSEHYQALERERREEKERLEKENNELQKSLVTAKDELLAVRTYVNIILCICICRLCLCVYTIKYSIMCTCTAVL